MDNSSNTGTPLDFDEIDVVPLSYEVFAKNLDTRITNYKQASSPRVKNYIQFSNIKLDGNKLTIFKEGQLFRRGTDYLESTSGNISVIIEPFDHKIRAKASIRPDTGLEVATAGIVAIAVLIYSIVFFIQDPSAKPVIIFVLLEFGVFIGIQINAKERHLALTRYYKNFLFNILNT